MSNLGKGFLISLCLHLIAGSAMAGIARMLERSEVADAVDISLLVIGPGGRGGASAGGLGPLSLEEGAAAAAFQDGQFNRPGSPEMARFAQPLAEKAAQPEKEYSAKPAEPAKERAEKAQPFITEAPALKPRQVPAAPPLNFPPMALKKKRERSSSDAGAGAGQRGKAASMPDAGQGRASGAPGSGGGPTGGVDGGNAGGNRGSVRGGAYFDRIHGLVRRHLEYPRQARRMGMTGRTSYSFIIEKDGAVTNLAVERSSGFGLLDEAGLKAIRSASPLPPPPERSHMVMPIDFRLR